VDKDAAIFFVEEFDCASVWVEGDGAAGGGRVFFVGEVDARVLGLERARDQGAEQGFVAVVAV
jgi:hypothetical protein